MVRTQQTEQDRFAAGRQNTKMTPVYQKHFKTKRANPTLSLLNKISTILHQRKEQSFLQSFYRQYP